MTNLGVACWILGMEIIHNRERRTIELSQRHYITLILIHFDMANGRPVLTPIDANVKLIKLAEAESNVKEYQSVLGALMYAMLVTRHNLAFAVGMLSKHTATPGQEPFPALK
jgi:hypothetical protein